MADSKLSKTDKDFALITAAMAYRVKYRIDEKKYRFELGIKRMGTHPNNRGTVYPSGLRCKTLLWTVGKSGFLKEEVNHACVVVEECPGTERPKGIESGSAYNRRKCSADQLLATCFKAPYDIVEYLMLSHNHMMMVLRAVLTQAKWDLEEIEDVIKFCDAEGLLSKAAVAESANGKELAEVIDEGILCEVLGYKMDIEEPTAAGIISEALNFPNSIHMRTSELSAISMLKGEIIAQQQANGLSQQVAYATVRRKVLKQLGHAADDPDLPEVFDWLISAGVGTNTFVDDLLSWTEVFVDSSKRRLRFTAWTVVNKMHVLGNWSRCAVLKRAYRKKPSASGTCPNPEALWGQFTWEVLQPMEDMLRYFHVGCRGYLDLMAPQSRIPLLANVDIVVAETLLASKDASFGKVSGDNLAPDTQKRMSTWLGKVQKTMIQNTHKYRKMLPLLDPNADNYQALTARLAETEAARPLWIIWPLEGKLAPAGETAVAEPVAPVILTFDEKTGARLNHQMEFPKEKPKKKKEVKHELPWREWLKGGGKPQGRVSADQATAVAVLHGLHDTYPVDEEPIDVWQTDTYKYVAVSRDIEKGTLLLPPCIPKHMKLALMSVHHYAVKIVVNQLPVTEGAALDGQQSLPSATFFANPEWTAPPTIPKKKQETAADEEDAAVADEDDIEWDWSQHDQITMHPYWAVRRMTEKQLCREIQIAKEAGKSPLPRFNCAFVTKVFNDVAVGLVKSGRSLNISKTVEVPFLTNEVQVHKGEELILQVQDSIKKIWKETQKPDDGQKPSKSKRKNTKRNKRLPNQNKKRTATREDRGRNEYAAVAGMIPQSQV